MIKETTATGETLDEAIANARVLLGAPADADVHTEIIELPKKKVLGIFGGGLAIVKATWEAPDAPKAEEPEHKPELEQVPQPVEEPKPEPAQKQPEPKKEDSKPEPKQETVSKAEGREEIEISSNDVLVAADSYLKTIILGMGAEKCEIKAFKGEDDDVVLELNVGEDYGIFIGKWGDTLDAIQYLTRLATNRVKPEGVDYPRISVNIGDYRQKRNTYLVELAIKKANYVKRTGKQYSFDPMNPYERRIVHTAIQDIEGVSSHSVGEEGNRRLVITPEGDFRRSRNGRGRNDRGRGGRNSRPSQKVDAPVREKKTDEGAKKTSLYGKLN